MTTTELVKQIKSLGKRGRKRVLQELLAGNGLDDIIEDLEDILISAARRKEPTIPADKVFRHIEKKRNLK